MTLPDEIGQIFISYESETGLPLARAIRSSLREEGIKGWVWKFDHPSGWIRTELARQIGISDYICFVCTDGTPTSKGQRWEIDNAFGQDKKEWVVYAQDRSFVPLAFAGDFHYQISLDDVEEVVANFLRRAHQGDQGVATMKNVVPTNSALDQNEQLSFTELVDVPR